ncbi:PDR/VanB family oxidoreductase [Streptomyces shenzhenensis]|uniref:PDR/VanB family oxidoreductase n=1 Tax=Streptomyces shenzhenensis TaxID=943815 RepID=UPI0036AE945E
MSASSSLPEHLLAVTERLDAADGVVSLTLRHPDGKPLPHWEPGAHIELMLDNGLARTYSLCGDPADLDRWHIAVLRTGDSRGGSAYVHDSLHPGTEIRVRGPRNAFALHPAERYLFVAGGIGITPLLPMIAAAESAGADWRLLYGGRSRASMAFVDRLQPYGARALICPQDEHGLLDLGTFLGRPVPGTLVYCCGPEPLLAAAERHSGGWPAGTQRTERFRSAGSDAAPEGPAFDVVCDASAVTVRVEPHQSVLAAVRAAGVDVMSSCNEGICGTCETDVLAGEPDHRDTVLGAAERAAGETMMICVSRSRGPRLVLDL